MKSEDIDIGRSQLLDGIVTPPRDISDDAGEVKHVYEFISSFVVGLLGPWPSIRKNIKDNPGTTLLDLITPAGIAYAVACIDNIWDKCVEEYEISKKSPEEQEKYKNVKKLPLDEQAAYTKTARPKYTDKKGQKFVYLGHGWSKEGVAFFKMVEQAWIDKFDNRTWYERFEVGWDEHVSSTGLGQHWKERTQSVTSRRAAGDESEEEEEALSAATFALPGNRGYAGGRAWKFGRQETPPSEYDSESELYSSDGDESNFLTRLNREKKRKVSV